MKKFYIEGCCVPEKHYMVDICERLAEIKAMVDDGLYFTINRGRQYGKTTTLKALTRYLRQEYIVIFLDFQKIGNEEFADANVFSKAFARCFLKTVKNRRNPIKGLEEDMLRELDSMVMSDEFLSLGVLFSNLSDLCDTAEKPVVLIIDEVDSATNNQVFLDFLAQLRGYYLEREDVATFKSVILAGVHDVKSLKLKIRPETEHDKFNSPWNIAAKFKVNMSFSVKDIAGMIRSYEADHHTGMEIDDVAKKIFDYTSGYPYLVSAICKLLDEDIPKMDMFKESASVWNEDGIVEAVKSIVKESAPFFDSMKRQLDRFPDLKEMLKDVIYQGRKIPFSADNEAMEKGVMFGFLKNNQDYVAISNRIFEMRLMALFVSENRNSPAQLLGERMKPQFIVNGHLDMDMVMEKFVEYHSDIFAENEEKYIERFGREIFLMFLKPIINGTGHYYLEAETRTMTKTDVVVDYLGEQFIIEMKLWHGKEYNERGEAQLCEYLDFYHKKKGYMLSFNFNKNKKQGIKKIQIGDKTIIEAVV